MDLTCGRPELVSEQDLQNWQWIGSGGFGKIYKVKHRRLRMDVAVKLLLGYRSPPLLLREADLMRQGNSPHVLRVLGVFQGRPPSSSSPQLGLVMEFMESGSLADLQVKLCGPPPWPLVFRIVHQIALGMNFLHHLPKPLLHLDLKPGNVLLDDSLTVKLADFGLARVYHSVSKETQNDCEEGGTINYMPPEAFQLEYRPTKAADIYSYGILLWSIITGEQPYPNALRSMVKYRIPLGDRPSLETLEQKQAPGVEELVDLMKACWDTDPQRRPSFLDCLDVTERLFDQHKQGICCAVYEVQNKLNPSNDVVQGVAELHISDPPPGSPNPSHHVKTGPPPKQEVADAFTSNQNHRQPQQGWQGCQPIKSLTGGAPAPSAANREPSPQPCGSDPVQVASSPTPDRRQKTGSKLAPPPHRTRQSHPQYQRCNSTPENAPRIDRAPGNVYIRNVYGIQIGNNNTMNISVPAASGVQKQKQRHRNPTAPPSVPLRPEQPASSKDKH